jgi:hypothetical protein
VNRLPQRGFNLGEQFRGLAESKETRHRGAKGPL